MKRKMFFTLFVCSAVLFSQENKLKIYKVSIAPVNYYFNAHIDGYAASINVSFKKGEHVFKVLGLAGNEVKVLTFGPGIRRSFCSMAIWSFKKKQIKKTAINSV